MKAMNAIKAMKAKETVKVMKAKKAMKVMKAMKAMKTKAMKARPAGKVMSKSDLADALGTEFELKRGQVAKVLECLAAVATKEVKSAGKFIVPGVCRIKTRTKPATKAGVRTMFGKEVRVKAKPAKTIVKAFPVQALKTVV